MSALLDSDADSSRGAHRISVSFPVMLAMFGVALIIFGSRYPRIFGFAYLLIAAGVYMRPHVHSALSRSSAVHAAIHLLIGLQMRLAAVPSAVYIGGFSAILFAMALTLWPGTQAPLPQFALGLALALLVWAIAAAVLPRPKGESGRTGWWTRAIGAVLIMAAFTGYFFVPAYYGTNIPFLDEQGPTLTFVLDYATQSWSERFAALIERHIDHRIATTRLAALAQYKIFGELNFYWLTLFSNVVLAVAAVVAVFSLPKDVRRPDLAAPFILILFTPQFYQLSVWAFSIPHFMVTLFGLLTFAFLARDSALGTFLAFVCAVVSVYSFATGVLITLFGLCILIDRRRYQSAVYWLIPATLLFVHYFDEMTATYGRNLAEGNSALTIPAASLSRKISYYLEFLGALATLGQYGDVVSLKKAGVDITVPAIWFARLTGVLLTLLFGYVSLRGYWKRNPVVYGMLLILMLSAVLATTDRSNLYEIPPGENFDFLRPETDVLGRWMINPPYQSRYMVNSCLFAAFLYLALLQLHPKAFKAHAPFVLLAAVVFAVSSFAAGVPLASAHSANLRLAGLVTANAMHQGVQPIEPPIPFYSVEAIQNVAAKSIYRLPEAQVIEQFCVHPIDTTKLTSTVGEVPWKLLAVGENSLAYTLVISQAPQQTSAVSDTAGVVVFGGGTGQLFEATPLHSLPGRDLVIKNAYSKEAGYLCVIKKADLQRGNWGVALARVDGGTVYMNDTGVRLSLQPAAN